MWKCIRNILHAWTSRSPAVDPLVGEAEAALLAISKASDLSLPNLILVGDSSLVLESLQQDPLSTFIPWKIRFLVQQALALLRRCSFWSTIELPRVDNYVAHSVAAWAAARARSFVGEVPPFSLVAVSWSLTARDRPKFWAPLSFVFCILFSL